MHLVDIVILVLLAAFAFMGSKQGFVQTLGQLIGAVLGFLAARAWAPWLAHAIGWATPGRPGLAFFIAFLLIFLFIDRCVGLLFKLVNGIFKIVSIIPFMSTINAGLGAVIGLAEGFVLVGSSVYLILTLRLDPALIRWVSGSIVANYAQRAFYSVLGYLL